MPNTPAQIGEGMTVWTATSDVTTSGRAGARDIFAALGREAYVPEEKYLDMATAVSGSGPAYVFLFIEALIDAGVHIGLPRDLASTMAMQTVLGSTRYALETGRHPAELRNQVTSPGGTTVEALRALEAGGLRAAVLDAVIGAYEKSRALGGGPSK
jgi:pyrroline-5-carboxylate reductase